MYKKSKIKIVMAIMFLMVSLLVGTLCIIYFASYAEVHKKNREMLDRYIEAYLINGNPDKALKEEIPITTSKTPKRFNKDHTFQMSTFYSVAIFQDGTISIDNAKGRTFSEKQLINFAYAVLEKQNESGTYGSLIYQVAQTQTYELVVFMDNTIMEESITTLFRYTLIFGCIAFIFIFFFSLVLAKKIIKPLEENAQKQKQFISDAGHELKTPVSAMNTNIEMLSREIGENKWLTNIQFENGRMDGVIRQLLELARTEHTVPQMSWIDFSRIVMGELLSFEIIAFEKELQFSYQEVSPKLYLNGNGEQLRQLVSILLDNAIFHSNKNGTILVSLTIKDKKICFSVENEGKEIKKEQRELIFERFFRTDYSRTGGENHYGLGLAIAKAIVSSHHGEIFVSCENGKVIFSALLPGKQE